MNNKVLGVILIIVAIILAIFFWSFRQDYIEAQKSRLINPDTTVECLHTGEGCPFEQIDKLTLPTILTYLVLAVLFITGVYLTFIDKSKKYIEDNQKRITEALSNVAKKESKDEKFKLILSALNEDEQKVMKAVKEQDGVSQATLRIRTDMSKTKLSFILSDLEKKNLVKKISKGKTNLIYLKRAI